MKKKKYNPNTKAAQKGASAAGFSFMNLYLCCQQKFFIRYLLRLEPNKIAPPLITGTAFHEGKEMFYNTHSAKKAVNKVQKVIESHEDDYEYAEQFEKDLLRFPLLLEVWIDQFGYSDLENYELLGVEKEIHVKVPNTNGFIMTVRIDLVYRDKTDKRIYLHDTKTSQFSKKITDMGLYYGNQATAYLWAAQEYYKERVEALIGDVAYFNRSAKTEANIDCYRTDLIIRSDRQINEFKLSVASLLNEISQKVEAWKSGEYEKAELFHRNTFYCNSYAKPCEYAEVCRTNIEGRKKPPPGLVRVPRNKNVTLGSYTLDQIVES